MMDHLQEFRIRVWDMLEGNARVGNLLPGKIRGNGMPDLILRILQQELDHNANAQFVDPGMA